MKNNAKCLGCQYNKRIDEDEMLERIKVMTEMAEAGDAEYQSALGTIYSTDRWIPHDYEKALKWLNLAIQNGNATAMLTLGNSYHEGDFTEIDYEKCFHFIELAAKQNYPQAVNNLAALYEEGQGTEKNLELALKYYKLACELGYDAEEDVERLENRLQRGNVSLNSLDNSKVG